MDIKIGKYQLNQSVNSNGFDLIEAVERTKKDSGEKYAAEKPLGYDMQLETCVKTIVMNNLKEKDEIVGMKEFLEEFKKQKEEIENLIKL